MLMVVGAGQQQRASISANWSRRTKMMKFFAVGLLTIIVITSTQAKSTSTKATTVETVEDVADLQDKKAIIAIEIIDPNDNSTKEGKGRKRTIEQALGNHGYQNFFSVRPRPPKYEVYKYRDDIPAFKEYNNYHNQKQSSIYSTSPAKHQLGGSSYQYHRQHEPGSNNFQVQKSIQYDLGSTAPVFIPNRNHHQTNLGKYYQHGTTLFSTLDQNGAVSGLTSQVPSAHGPMVPVIILRVYTNQLNQGEILHPNIPRGHPYANLNSLDLNRLLSGYVNQHNGYQDPVDQGPKQQDYSPPAQTNQEYLPPAQSNQQYIPPSPTNQEYLPPAQTNQEYLPPVANSQEYLPPNQEYSAQKQEYLPPKQEYLPSTNLAQPNQAQHVEDGPESYSQNYQSNIDHQQTGLLTHENYPDDAHTKVIFHKNIKNSTPKSPQKFKITIPSNTFSKVEIQDHTYNKQQPEEYQSPQVANIGHNQQHPQPQYNYQQQQQYQQESPYQYYQQPISPQQYSQQPYSYESPQQYQQEQQYQQQQQSLQYQGEQRYQGLEQNQHQHQGQYQSGDQNEASYLYSNPEQGNENQDFSLIKHSNDAGRDLHPKVFNYHALAHNAVHVHKTRSAMQNKKKRSRIPLVLSPRLIREQLKIKDQEE